MIIKPQWFINVANERNDRICMKVVHFINDKFLNHFSINNNVSSNLITIKDTVFKHIKDDLFKTIGVATHDYAITTIDSHI